ncbi:MAG: phosphoadenosine phosphosulfate reductase family protein [Nitrospirota bacterium]
MTEKGKKEMSSRGLEEKINFSKNIIREAIERFNDRLVIAWTGGKDSTTMLWLYKTTCAESGKPLPRCLFINEGDVFPEILEHVDAVKKMWEVQIIELKNDDVLNKIKQIGDIVKVDDLNERNKRELEHIGFKEKEFAFEPESFEGNHLMKTVPMKLFIEDNRIEAVSTAIRWDEQEARKEEVYLSERNNPPHTRVQPLLHFRERDIWNTIHKYKIPCCSLYELGYRSLGARCSTHKNSDIPAWKQDLENTPERVGRGQHKEKIMEQLRSLGYM